jgi:pyrroline-5-carboxylate reductase
MAASLLPVLVAGAGNMGGAIIAGWRFTGAVDPADLIVRDPHPGLEALLAVEAGARLNPPDGALMAARAVLLGVKPAVWRAAAAEIAPRLDPSAVIISIVAGVAEGDLSEAFEGRPIVRVMPTTAVAVGQGAIAIHAEDPALRRAVGRLFEALGAVVELANEEQMHAATAASGSGPAYLYAFIEALEAAAADSGLGAEAAARMVRASLTGAAALLRQSGEDPAELRRRVTSPGGTTEAALKILMGPDGLEPLLRHAVEAAVKRSGELGG